MLIKKCIKCKHIKNLDLFTSDIRSPDGKTSTCKHCFKENTKIKRKNRIDLGVCTKCNKPPLQGLQNCALHHVVSLCRLKVHKARILLKKLELNSKCPYLDTPLKLADNSTHLDHIFPKSRFPNLSKEVENFEWLSKIANVAKQDMTKEEFIAFCKAIILYTGYKGDM